MYLSVITKYEYIIPILCKHVRNRDFFIIIIKGLILMDAKAIKREYFNEYMFYQAVRDANMQRINAGKSRLTTSQGRALHKQFVDSLQKQGMSMARVGFTRFATTANEVFFDVCGGDLFDMTGGNTSSAYREYFDAANKFSNMCGFGGNSSAMEPMLPLSPFDERYADRYVFRRNGGELLYSPIGGKLDDNNRMRPGIMDSNGNLTGANESYSLLYRQKGKSFVSVGQALSENDKSGMSVLMPYLRESEIESLSDWLAKPGREDANQFMSSKAVHRAAAVLRCLQEEGISYEVDKDAKEGQLVARLTGTKINVRLTDTRDNEHFIGRVYDNGYSIRYATNKTAANGQGKVAYSNPSAEDTLKLIQFALGRSVSRTDSNQPVGLLNTYKRGQYTMSNAFFSKGKSTQFTAVVGPYPKDNYSNVRIHVDNKRSASSLRFSTDEAAEGYLRNAIESARQNFMQAIDVDYLVNEAKEHAGEDGYFPEFNGDSGIAAIQQAYWEVLTGSQDILKPGKGVEEYQEAIGSVDGVADSDITAVMEGNANARQRAEYMYSGTPEEKVRQHLMDNTDYLIGYYDKDENGKRFDPVIVASHMSSETGQFRNNDDIVSAIRTLNISPDELKGSDFYNAVLKDKLIKFNADTAKPMMQSASPFIRDMFTEIKRTINETGCAVRDRDILIDDNGIVHWTAQRSIRERHVQGKEAVVPVTGEIGQIFAPDGMGLVETKFGGSDNYVFAPGYEAYVLPQKTGENKSVEERTRLRGYEQLMRQQIAYQVRSDILEYVPECGSTTSLNNVYRRTYDTRYSLDYMETARLEGMSDDLFKAIVETNARRVRYATEYRDESTINADFRAKNLGEQDSIINDNFADCFSRTGRNMSIMTEEGDGYFDPIATGTSTNQGVTRFLVDGSTVNADGSITPSDDKSARTPLMENDVCKFMKYTPFDRQQMTFSNLTKAACVAHDVHTAHMTFGGWTFDDGYVVSKNFADTYKVKGIDGKLRSLVAGDKISDMNGNKGVISLVVDPDMPIEDAKAQGIEKPVAWFKANKGHLDIVGAPFTAPSRFNGGTAREMMQNPQNLVSPDGKVLEGCVGQANYIVTHMTVDEKTHIYGEDELSKGKGRRASAQWAWALDSQDATAVLREAYGSNSKTTANLREMLITCGLDMDALGNTRVGYKPHPNEKRKYWRMPNLEYRDGKNGPILDVRTMKQKFSDIISQSGGFLEIPFELKYPTGNSFMKFSNESDTYAMPIMSSHLRSGQMFADGTSHVHDYTVNYLRIYEYSLRYRDAQANGDTAKMNAYKAQAQAEYTTLTNDLSQRQFEGKHNIFRDGLMGNRMSHSCTAVWTADPRLEIDQIAMSSQMAASLGVKENDYVMTWRDPVLRDAGVRYNRVAIDDRLTGVAINPVMDKSYDGDFDGDSIGIWAPQTQAAKKDAFDKLSVNANLLDYGVKKEDGTFDLMIQDSLDMKSVEYNNPELNERIADLTKRANDSANIADKKSRQNAQALIVNDISKLAHDALGEAYGTDVISYKDMESHLKSVEHMVINGAKGSYGKLSSYARYLGVEFDIKTDKEGKEYIDYNTVKDYGKTLATRQDNENVEYATAVKAFGTGVAGKYSQRLIAQLRNECPKAALELTYPVTQSVLQAKHDPVDARHKYELLMGPARAIWRGQKIDRTVDENGEISWKTVTENGQPVQLSKDEWTKTIADFYQSKDGLNVKINTDYIHQIANVLSTKHGLMKNIEGDGYNASFMDSMAYDGNFDRLYEGAKQGKNIFEGKYNKCFMPRSISDNELVTEYGGDIKPVMKTDTKSDVRTKFKTDSVKTVRNIPFEYVSVSEENDGQDFGE